MEQTHPSKTLEKVLIAGITPYFLEKGNVWFQENFAQILKARQTQAFFQENTLFLEKDQEHSLSELLRKLDEMGYEKVFEVRDPGEFSHVGGHVEVFPINSSNAIRIEFLGNKVETIERLQKSADEETSKNVLKKRLKSQKLFSDIKNLKEGEYLVHLDHGVGRFVGMQELMPGHPYYTLEYLGQDKLFVPVGLERKLSRYVGFGEPHIARLGSPFWSKTKRKIKEEVEKLAQQLLDLYAQREVTSRLPYQEPSILSEHVAASFQYEETPDQRQALQEISKDLDRTEPMDRLLCGDVGFGKTEVALRTMVRAVEQGYQTALLAPTTILAYQHFQNFTERMKGLPAHVVLLSRLQTKKEQHIALEKIRTGKADLVVSTHRLFSSDVQFKNLGLLVIDDEQRFGVKQKEKLRELRTSLDVLSLSATPIPRTLYMSLASLKNISVIQTPPEGRFPVHIMVQKRNEKIIREAIEKELARKGQVYYLHNRIGTIALVKKHLEHLAPKARIGIVHGRLNERELIEVMDEFKNRTYDVLVATTIIENGLDLPNVNTLVVEDATRLGLSQAYQIRGRVGRSHTESFAYFLHGAKLEGKAKLRLQALSEAGALGSGYRIALRDMEIRGAGNILGKEQSGNVNAIGLNLYCQMLAESVEKLKIAKPAP
jgi:transcription-repair coupling factor (superfamily II helicase)